MRLSIIAPGHHVNDKRVQGTYCEALHPSLSYDALARRIMRRVGRSVHISWWIAARHWLRKLDTICKFLVWSLCSACSVSIVFWPLFLGFGILSFDVRFVACNIKTDVSTTINFKVIVCVREFSKSWSLSFFQKHFGNELLYVAKVIYIPK